MDHKNTLTEISENPIETPVNTTLTKRSRNTAHEADRDQRRVSKHLNSPLLLFAEMEVRKILMTNGHEFEVLWDKSNLTDDTFYRMIDLNVGWVHLNPQLISAMVDRGRLRDKGAVPAFIRKCIVDQYGEEAFA